MAFAIVFQELLHLLQSIIAKSLRTLTAAKNDRHFSVPPASHLPAAVGILDSRCGCIALDFVKLLRTACNDLKVSASLNWSRLQRANDLGVGSGWEAVVMFINCQVQVVGKPHFEPVVR